MSLARTTLTAAFALDESKVAITSATGVAAGYMGRVDGETLQVAKAYVSGSLIVPVLRGQDGTVAQAHPSGAGIVFGAASDTEWGTGNPTSPVKFPLSGKPLLSVSYSASGAIALPNPGSDLQVELNGTSVLAMTVAAPGKANEGDKMWISSNGAAAHTIDFTGGLSGAGSSYNLLTVNATAPVTLGPFVAVNSLWQAPANIALAGNAANVTATVG